MSDLQKSNDYTEDNLNCDVSFENNEVLVEEKDIFVKAAVEEKMHNYWPDPASEFYCRICNYLEFDSDETLTKHNETDDHKLRLANEKTSFCLICQVHTYNDKLMEKHMESDHHKKLQNLFKEAEANAEVLWNGKEKQKAKETVEAKIHVKIAEPGNQEENMDEEAVEKKQRPDWREILLKLEEVYSNHGHKYNEECELMRSEMIKFFDEKHIYTGVVDSAFNLLAQIHCLKDYYPVIEERYFCSECNNLTFSNEREKLAHEKTDSHKVYVAARRSGNCCKVCRINYLEKDSYEKHLEDERHIKLACLMHVCKSESFRIIEEIKKAEVNYEIMSERLYPEKGLVQEFDFCRVCTRDIPKKSGRSHVRMNRRHSRNFQRFIQKTKQLGYTFQDGCALCRVSKKDDSGYNMEEHVKKVEHLERYVTYEKSHGLVDSRGILGIFVGEKQEFQKMNENKKGSIDAEMSTKEESIKNKDSSSNKRKRKNEQKDVKNKKPLTDSVPRVTEPKLGRQSATTDRTISRQNTDRFSVVNSRNNFSGDPPHTTFSNHPRIYQPPESNQRFNQVPYSMQNERYGRMLPLAPVSNGIHQSYFGMPQHRVDEYGNRNNRYSREYGNRSQYFMHDGPHSERMQHNGHGNHKIYER